MFQIFFTDPAETDLISTLQYISQVLKSPDAAKKLFDEIEQKIKILEDMPFCLPLVNDDYLASKNIRSMLVKNYLIFYVIDDIKNIVSIIRILYARRDWLDLLKDN